MAMRSMTGYGRSKKLVDGREMTVEVKAVNHRFLDISLRFPRSLGFLEEVARKALSARLSRGHVDVNLIYRNTREDARQVVFDEALLSAYMQSFDRARDRYGLKNDKSISMLSALPDVFSVVETQEDIGAIKALFSACMEEAMDSLIHMRQIEGEALSQDILSRLLAVERLHARVAACAGETVALYRDRLRQRIVELSMGDVDESRIAQEAAIFADRSAIDEELVRLASHIQQIRAALKTTEPVGRKLDFIVQELNREANTIGSKAAGLSIVDCVVEMKSEMEKIREQVQNIE